jgi:hypothetical protein
MIKEKNVNDFHISEDSEKLEKRRKATFNFSQNYTNIHKTKIPISQRSS